MAIMKLCIQIENISDAEPAFPQMDWHVPVPICEKDLELSLYDFMEYYAKPAIAQVCNKWKSEAANERGMANLVAEIDSLPAAADSEQP